MKRKLTAILLTIIIAPILLACNGDIEKFNQPVCRSFWGAQGRVYQICK